MRREIIRGPVCGVYATRAALDAAGIEPPSLAELLRPEYVGRRGSTTHAIQRMVENCGGTASPVTNASFSMLRHSTEPCILHVRSSASSDSVFDHWVVFLGMNGARFRILDPPGDVRELTASELAASWDSTAIFVRAGDSKAIWPYWRQVLLFEHLPVFAVVLTVVVSLPPKRRRIVIQVAATVLLSVLFDLIREQSLMLNLPICRRVASLHEDASFSEVSRHEIAQLVDQGAVLLDARFTPDYGKGSLPNAISLPFVADFWERQERLAGIAKSRCIIMFCQSSGCRFSDKLGRLLKSDGWDDIRIYRGGIREWRESRD